MKTLTKWILLIQRSLDLTNTRTIPPLTKSTSAIKMVRDLLLFNRHIHIAQLTLLLVPHFHIWAPQRTCSRLAVRGRCVYSGMLSINPARGAATSLYSTQSGVLFLICWPDGYNWACESHIHFLIEWLNNVLNWDKRLGYRLRGTRCRLHNYLTSIIPSGDCSMRH